ncbi:MAG: hypothetical protein WCW30_04815 [Candidatus Gracilibacteria bacterium]
MTIQTCTQCAKSFQSNDSDHKFYEKLNLSSPKRCPDCRLKTRLAFRNERNLYRRNCDLTKQSIISIYSPEKPYKIYQQDAWWSNKWDETSYGKVFDFSRPFFDQYKELLLAVPHPAVGYRFQSENCEYTTYQDHSKNCYVCSGSGYMEDCLYTNWTNYAKNSMDILGSHDIELCYELIDCKKMYQSTHCQDSSVLTTCHYCYDCHSCSNCFGCVGLRHQKFCFLNEPLTEAAYQEKIKNLNVDSFVKDLKKIYLNIPRRALFLINCDHCTGDRLVHCKNTQNSFYGDILQDCNYNQDAYKNTDCHDMTRAAEAQMCYECIGGGDYYFCNFFVAGEHASYCTYCIFCFNSKNLFGCVGMKGHEYCILNTKYSKEEYEKLKMAIIEHMKKTGEWGEFFPINMSPFDYNESLAEDFFPSSKQEIVPKGFHWETKNISSFSEQNHPNTNEVCNCALCGKKYLTVVQELKFYRSMKLPLPSICPNCRHLSRMTKRNPRTLWNRQCAKCNVEIQTTYAPNRPEIVYCESCYLKTIY